MPYDDGVAQRVREALDHRDDVIEKKMFGGIAFMVSGHMCCGVVGESLMARVGPDQYDGVLRRPHAREMDFTGRPMKGFVYVDAQGFDSDEDLASWITLCMDYIATLPPK